MSLEVQLLWLPRAGASALEYEAVCVHDRSETYPFRIALADPDPATLRPELWADLLARGFVDEGALGSASVRTDLMLRQATYAACVASEPYRGEVAEPARTGFAGLTIEPGNRWKLICSSGYCVVKLSGGGYSSSMDDDLFDKQSAPGPECTPQASELAERKTICSMLPQSAPLNAFQGHWEVGDRLLLCNPTAAPWLGRETTRSVINRIATSSLAGFQGLAKRTRLDGRLEGGDVAVAVVQL
jgi:hypothetical protein